MSDEKPASTSEVFPIPSVAPSEEKFPRYETWTKAQRDYWRANRTYPKFTPEQMGHREAPPDPGLPPTTNDKTKDGGYYRYWDAEGKYREAEYNAALADWNEKNDVANESLKARLKETAKEHDVEESVLYDTATKFLKSKALMPIVSYTGNSPEFSDLLCVLSEGGTLNKLIATAKTDPRAALEALVGMEQDIRKARLRSLNQPRQKKRELSGSTNPDRDKPLKVHPWARGGYRAFKEKFQAASPTGHAVRSRSR